jgi:hypothetical protein
VRAKPNGVKQMPKQQILTRQIVDSTGSYLVSYLPGRKIEIKLPGTKHVVIFGPLRSRKNTGISVLAVMATSS